MSERRSVRGATGTGSGGNPPAGTNPADPQLAVQLEQQTQLIAALQGQVNALANQLTQQQNQPPAIPTFAFSPAQLHSGNEILNYENKVHLDIFKTSSAPFSDKFDGSKEKLPSLKAEIMARAPIGGWDSQGSDVINIPSENDPTVKINIVKEHPKITTEWVKTWAATNFVGQSNRMAQNNFNMFTALESSIEAKFKSAHLVNDEDKYTVNGTKVAALYLMLIYKKCEVGTAASIYVLRSQLHNLEKIMKECDNNVIEFNAKAKDLIAKLQSHGKEVNDMEQKLFSAYLEVRDEEFTRAIKDKKQGYLLGATSFTYQELMAFAENLYSLMVEEGSWGKHVNPEEQIVALTTEIKLLKSQAASTKNSSKKTKKNKNSNGDGKKGGNDNNKNTKNDKNLYADWMLKAPESGQAKTKTVNDKRYWWCPHHQEGKGQWVRHKPEDHKFKSSDDKSKGKNKDNMPKADVAAAVAEFLEREE